MDKEKYNDLTVDNIDYAKVDNNIIITFDWSASKVGFGSYQLILNIEDMSWVADDEYMEGEGDYSFLQLLFEHVPKEKDYSLLWAIKNFIK